MERLKADEISGCLHAFTIFTFQYGEIKSWIRKHKLHAKKIFTFQYGEIKSPLGQAPAVNRRHLHSSMERLKVCRMERRG